MLMESFVAVMALCAATALEPGVYFAINAPLATLGDTAEKAAEAVRNWGFALTPERMTSLAAAVGETTLIGRTGGATSLAVGMAYIFSGVLGQGMMAFWYHFAIMFEALFILTTLDAGSRVGRFMVQELGAHLWKLRGHDPAHQVREDAVCLGDAGAAQLAADGDLDRGLPEDLLAGAAARLPGACADDCRTDCRRHHGPDDRSAHHRQ
jgi:carbon starvation protein CstA